MKKYSILILLAMICSLGVIAQEEDGPTAEPTISFINRDTNSEVVMSPGESQSMQAPLDITMTANIKNDSGWNSKSEWRLWDGKKTESETIFTRFEEVSTYTLTKSGEYKAKLYVTFSNTDRDTIQYESETFSISISQSKLSCPDGFSPNGDKINDTFKITFQSIIKLSGGVFNRWGQKLFTFNLENAAEGWDGRYNGEYVKDGAYMLNIQATGSDGIHYDIKKVINVLKGFREYNQ